MLKYILKRILMLIPVIIGVTFMVYMIISFTPGDPVKMILGQEATNEAIEQLTQELGLDKPVLIQYGNYMLKLIQGDLGRSYFTNRSVLSDILARLPLTFTLTMVSVIIGAVIAMPLGIYASTKQYSLLDNFSMLFTLLGVSMPTFWFGLLLMLGFSLSLGWLPSSGYTGPASLILPSVTLGISNVAIVARMTRSAMLEVIRQDYIRTAKSKGVSGSSVILKHSLKNAMIPIVTIIGLQIGAQLGGAMITENVFALPGLGSFTLTAIRSRDTPQVVGSVIVFTVLFSVVNLVIDILYAFIDPRIKAAYK
jgi:peptide/nickel transport system permease protein